DIYTNRNFRSFDGLRNILELCKVPSTPLYPVASIILLFPFGTWSTGFPSILHSGAVAALLDEAYG
ncbi:hypothetical protein K432DRAFT_286150, partial [Lepidopterella palustris CBS 459.81]